MADVNKLPGGGSIKFSLMIEEGKVYIDKTDLVAKLASKRGQICFLTRPRRFGKTTLISTFNELFTNGTGHFTNLKLCKDNLWHDDNRYNVVSLNFCRFSDLPNFGAHFANYLSSRFTEKGIEVILSKNEDCQLGFPVAAFSSAFAKLADQSVVLLIDEYDTPLNQVLDNEPEFNIRRSIMEQFYGLLKDHCSKFRFVFITGIGRFLDPDNLYECPNFLDISYKEEYAAITGFTTEEITSYLKEYLEHAAAELNLAMPRKSWDLNKVLEKIIEEYGGYCFDPMGKVKVCTPWDVLLFLTNPAEGFNSYWTDSGGCANHLIVNWLRQIRSYGRGLSYLSGYTFKGYSKNMFFGEIACHINNVDQSDDTLIFPYYELLLQTGYFTIKQRISSIKEKLFVEFVVGVPNKEVLHLFHDLTVAELTRNAEVSDVATLDCLYGRKLRTAVRSENIKEIQLQLNRLINIFPSETLPKFNETNLKELLHIIFHLLDFKLTYKARGVTGYFDLTFENTKTIYLFALKVIKDCSGIDKACKEVQAQQRLYMPKGCTRDYSYLTRKQVFEYVMVIIRDPLRGNGAADPEVVKAFRAVEDASDEPVRSLVLLKELEA